jgi:hypothetical protein
VVLFAALEVRSSWRIFSLSSNTSPRKNLGSFSPQLSRLFCTASPESRCVVRVSVAEASATRNLGTVALCLVGAGAYAAMLARLAFPQQSDNLARLPTFNAISAVGTQFVPALCLIKKPEFGGLASARMEIYAKRKRDSSGATTRAGCLGIQVARIGCGRHSKASQNSYRVGPTVDRRITCSSGNFGLTC